MLQSEFASEFVLIADSRWIVMLIAGLLVANALLSTVPRSGARVREFLVRALRPLPLRILFIVVSVASAAGLLAIGSFLVLLLLDYFTGTLVVGLLLIGAVFAGLAVVLVADAFSFKRPPAGLLLVPIILVSFFVAGTRVALYAPTWAGGTEHTTVFARGDQPGRAYRIPALVPLPGGEIVAFAESRANAFLDWGDIDIVVRRSADGGRTWGAIQTVADAGDRTAGNPCPVYDSSTGTLFLPYTIDNKNVLLVSSTDNGRSWSEPRDLTEEFGIGAEWNPHRFDYRYGTGPGVGIETTTGRLVVPAYEFGGTSHVIYSDDHGRTWQRGGSVEPGGEAQVAELSSGTLLMTIRHDGGGERYFRLSEDGGTTWAPLEVSDTVPDVGCMAAITAGDGVLYYSSPGADSRSRLTIRRSRDGGLSWERMETVYTGPSAYSQVAVVGGDLLVLFEQGRIDYRESIQLAWIDLQPR